MADEIAPVWKGKSIATIGDLAKVMEEIQTFEEGKEFMDFLRKHDKNADHNVGYITGYYSAATGKRMRRLLGVAHPFVREG